ncbi:MAG: AmmeMemoRadiSam system radical SAM enzyme [Candidatus Omnitrophica bacterium]|nr:AmmeMemoRadiSam system radical SAM enzyme [Candidatus Omnitrophota bacterium]
MNCKEALFYETLANGKVHCLLCPQSCQISDGKFGFCRVRKNLKGKLCSLIYGEITSIALDPIEKKPLYHYHPGEYILSVGTKGCNLACPFCQNWSISQDDVASTQSITSQELIKKAQELNSFGIAYTYNEPFIWYEFVLDTARLAKKEGLENVLVTNGFVNLKPLEEILPFIDAMNIDLKSIDDDFYRKICKGRINPVLETIKRSHSSCHIELTNLIIPTLNDKEDNFRRLVDWIFDNLGPEVPLHFSRYFPCFKIDIPPTPVDTLKKAEQIARKKLKYVYLGNI